MSENIENVKILIVGAGMAGLSAANHLLQNGCDNFKIIEARNRIGGRIISIPIDQHKIELGANWIHGVLGNPIFELAIKHGLVNIINVPKPHHIVATTESGKQVPFEILQEIYEAYVCFLRRCDEYFLCQYSPPPDINSVGEHINYEIEIYLSSIEDFKERHIKKMIFNCLLKRETCITGCHNMNEIDLLELGSYTELQGGNIVLQDGYSSILEPMHKELPPESIIKNCPVKKIFWKRKKTHSGLETVDENSENESDDSDKTVTEFPIGGNNNSSNTNSKPSSFESGENENLVKVLCEDGRQFNAEHVICTLPLGVLKANSSNIFDPVLPHHKLESIKNLMFGTVDKIFLEYERPFLNAEITEVMLLWDDEDTLSSCADKCSNEYLAKNWFKKIYSFAKITETLLLGWISGKEAEYMETLPNETVTEKCTEILRNFLKDPFVPKPKRCVCTNWKTQPYTVGSYTSIPVGATQEDIENLAQPLYSSPLQSKPSILFAGEHTHSNFYSTVHGAYLSGRSAAQILLTNEEPEEIILESDSSDLSSWIQGIALD
ncbi:peroxisomal N(1)-acetyl-spermine/spermidine oxidase [Condylostylus longicornis]|uniref:peroxisomal N(1)-acetyl-spermine/spermidine oxidase n=1 Tax=Condylostylus longicornis TaxID=2530218 RepID=UPI00244DEC64|nr:peroxisomal N(1)-acetyl-spermine/spermidine oxidase [Condylostylus longicornis]